MKSFAVATLLAASTLAATIGDVQVKTKDAEPKNVLSASSTGEYSITGEEGARVLKSTFSYSVEMEGGDYVIEDLIGKPYVWQCIEQRPGSEGADPALVDCVVCRWETETKDNVLIHALRIQKWEVEFASYKFTEEDVDALTSPIKYFEGLVTGSKATYKGESEFASQDGGDFAVVTEDDPPPLQDEGEVSLTKSSVSVKSASLVMEEVKNGKDSVTQLSIELTRSSMPYLTYKGTFGGWYNMRVQDNSGDKVQWYTVEDVNFKMSDSSDSAFAFSATIGVAAVYAALAF